MSCLMRKHHIPRNLRGLFSTPYIERRVSYRKYVNSGADIDVGRTDLTINLLNLQPLPLTSLALVNLPNTTHQDSPSILPNIYPKLPCLSFPRPVRANLRLTSRLPPPSD